MKKYVLNSPVADVSSITTFRRNYDGSGTPSRGILVNSTHIAILDWEERTEIDTNNSKAKYSSIIYKGNRKVDILPESTTSNTLITSDGLVGVVYTLNSNNYISVIDLYDKGNLTYNNITPGANDYEAIQSYIYGKNPEHKRLFIFSRGSTVTDYLSVNNNLVYQKSEGDPLISYSYFESEMEYDIPTDEYGYYRILTSAWSTYSSVTEFQFFKKQFFVVSGPVDLKLYINNVEVAPYVSGTNIYYFPDLNIYNDSGTDNRFLKFKLKSETSNYGTVIVY